MVDPAADKTPVILVVEDYKPNTLVVTFILEKNGYRYDLAQHGREAVEKCQSNKYDLILMDIQMPIMDGVTATQILRNEEKIGNKSRTSIIGVTAFALRGDREKFLDAGMDDYISKPFQPHELEQKIKEYLA